MRCRCCVRAISFGLAHSVVALAYASLAFGLSFGAEIALSESGGRHGVSYRAQSKWLLCTAVRVE